MKTGSIQNVFKVFWQILWERLLLGDDGKKGSCSLECDQNFWYRNREEGRVIVPVE
jgi:hypothetical protein